MVGIVKERYLSEKETRKHIDKQLQKRGWISNYIKEELNSVRSNFKEKQYVLREGPDDSSGRFIDYLLLSEDYSPLAFIEAKKFSVSEDKARIQARTYLSDIKNQTNDPIPYFLTNGTKWLLIDQDGIERQISGPFSQSDLMRRAEKYKKKEDPTKINIRIVSRPRSVIIVKQMLEHLNNGHRAGLISMATGTGKTRVAMSMIDVLMRANMVGNVLFVTDRIALANQAKSVGFKEFFSEPVTDLRDDPESFPNGLYVTTVQTLRGGKKEKYYEKFSPGFFDLIIFDEAHRSIYDPNREVHRYFDAIRIGLTATPSRAEDKNTFELFDCNGNRATVEYTYDEAIKDGILVPYNGQVIDTNVLSLGIEGAKLTKDLKDQLRRQEIDPNYAKFPGSTFAKVFMDNKTNELVVREFLARCYKSDDGKPAKTIFFCVNIKHAKHTKKIFSKIAPNLSKDVQDIVSDYYRYADEINRFKLDSEPRIALSVGVLDTGIDIPEVCNLVFVKPVFTDIRFWQMVGRGTRDLESCKNKDWLPNREKKDFLILDFTIGGHSNIRYHKFKEAKERKVATDVFTKIFINRVDLLKKKLDPKQKGFIEEKILYDINSLDKDSFIVREKLPIIKKVVSRKFDLKTHIGELKKEIAPLISLNPSTSPLISSFILQVEKLLGYILEENNEKIYKIREYVNEKMVNILEKDNLESVQAKRNDIYRVLQENFWEEISFDDVEFIIRVLSPLMIYYEPNPKKIIQVDAPDTVLNVERFRHEVKEDETLKNFVESSSLMRKIKNGIGVTSLELLQLEKELNQIRPEITIENVQRIQNTDFILFLRQILGLSQEYDPKELIEREFDKHIIEANRNYNSDQLQILSVLKKIFARTKRIELKDFASAPLSNDRPLDKFQISELQKIVDECNKIKMK